MRFDRRMVRVLLAAALLGLPAMTVAVAAPECCVRPVAAGPTAIGSSCHAAGAAPTIRCCTPGEGQAQTAVVGSTASTLSAPELSLARLASVETRPLGPSRLSTPTRLAARLHDVGRYTLFDSLLI
jgi:hypothetical protein